MLKKLISVVFLLTAFAFANVSVTHAASQAETPYKDVKETHFAYKEIMKMTSLNYMTGTSSNSFQPNLNVTRAEAALTIARSLNLDQACTYQPKFTDVDPGAPYYNAVCQLAKAGIVNDTEEFKPQSNLTRAQFTIMMVNAYQVEADSVNRKHFKDVKKDFWAKSQIESLADLGIVGAVDGVNFAPQRNVTRAQLAVMICRALEFKGKIHDKRLIYDSLSKHYIETVNYSKQWATEVVRLVNVERKKEDLPALIEDQDLSQIAVIKARDFVNRNYFNHYSPYYEQPWDLASLFDYEFSSLGENIARNYPSPSEVVKAWMASEGHRANILRPQYTNLGVGIKKSSDGTIYWVQLFASK